MKKILQEIEQRAHAILFYFTNYRIFLIVLSNYAPCSTIKFPRVIFLFKTVNKKTAKTCFVRSADANILDEMNFKICTDTVKSKGIG